MFWQFPPEFKQQTALIFDNQALSYSQLQTLCSQAAEHLPEAGTLVFLRWQNNLQTVVTYLACLQQKVAVMLLDYHLPEAALDNLSRAYQPHSIIGNGDVTKTGYPQSGLDQRLAVLLSTSGSTGTAKQVALSYDNLQANAGAICQYLPIRSDDVTLTTLPGYYSYGLSVLNTHLLRGACTLLSEASVVSPGFWQSLKDYPISSFAGVPHTYEMLIKLGFLRKHYPNLRYLTQAGGRLADDLIRSLVNGLSPHDVPLYVMYGQTEATARMAWLPPDKLPEKVGSIGNAIPGGQFRLEDDSGNLINECEVVGELVYEGDNVMLGYANCRTELEHFEPPGALKTGDIARRDKEGDYFIVGRKKRFVKLLGFRINLDEVEKIMEAAGFDAKVTGTDQMLYIALSKPDLEKQATSVLSKTIKLHHSLIQAGYIPDVPLNANNKTDYPALLQWFKDGQHRD